ncbi:MAG: polyprenyl synthetase family protein [Tepidiformaceae bacterium]
MTAADSSAPEILTRHLQALEAALRHAIGSDGTPLTSTARYVMGWEDERGAPIDAGGKRIRPALCLFAAEAFGGAIDDAMPGAVAVELVHNFSLVHDEVQDHDAERHHRPTVWARMGEGQAINAGDFLYTRALRSLTGGAGDTSRRMRALAVLNNAIERMIQGQWEDISFELRDQVTVDEYLGMVAGKTGALLSAPLEMGAILAGATDSEAAALGTWGEHVGAAFQAQDDYLGIWGDPDQTGKSNKNDIARRKKTLPIVHGTMQPAAASIIQRVYSEASVSEAGVAQVVQALDAAGSGEYCRDRARSQVQQADALLETLPFLSDTPGLRDKFRTIAAYLVERQA